VVDKTLILRKLSTLDEYLTQIGEYTSTKVEAYAGDWRVQRNEHTDETLFSFTG